MKWNTETWAQKWEMLTNVRKFNSISNKFKLKFLCANCLESAHKDIMQIKKNSNWAAFINEKILINSCDTKIKYSIVNYPKIKHLKFLETIKLTDEKPVDIPYNVAYWYLLKDINHVIKARKKPQWNKKMKTRRGISEWHKSCIVNMCLVAHFSLVYLLCYIFSFHIFFW